MGCDFIIVFIYLIYSAVDIILRHFTVVLRKTRLYYYF